MSHELVNLVKSRSFGSASRKAVMLLLADYADTATDETVVGQVRLAREAEMGERSVRRTLATLTTMGVITRRHRRDEGGHRTSDRVTLLWDAIESLPATDGRQPANERVPTGQALAGEPLVATGGRTARRRQTKGQRPLPLFVHGVTTTREGTHAPGSGFIPCVGSGWDEGTG